MSGSLLMAWKYSYSFREMMIMMAVLSVWVLIMNICVTTCARNRKSKRRSESLILHVNLYAIGVFVCFQIAQLSFLFLLAK